METKQEPSAVWNQTSNSDSDNGTQVCWSISTVNVQPKNYMGVVHIAPKSLSFLQIMFIVKLKDPPHTHTQFFSDSFCLKILNATYHFTQFILLQIFRNSSYSPCKLDFIRRESSAKNNLSLCVVHVHGRCISRVAQLLRLSTVAIRLIGDNSRWFTLQMGTLLPL